jgi:hypothetical protein
MYIYVQKGQLQCATILNNHVSISMLHNIYGSDVLSFARLVNSTFRYLQVIW